MRLEAGDVVNDRYMIIGVLGQGGQGIVYRARDLRVATEVAVKFLKTELAQDPGVRERWAREVQALAVLQDAAVVRILDLDTYQGQARYMVMELLKGRDFEAYLQQLEAKGQRLSLAELRELIEPVVDTLHTAHACGIVHRDLKPHNLFVLARPHLGRVRLLDFGMAKVMNADPLTGTGMIAGSPSYIAPEAWRGQPQDLDRRIDVYALGALLFRALAGRVPFEGKGIVDTFRQVTSAERPSLHRLRPDLPPLIDDWTRMALSVKPESRFQTVGALWGAFLDVLGG